MMPAGGSADAALAVAVADAAMVFWTGWARRVGGYERRREAVELGPGAREILDALAAGIIDEAGARRIGVSLRTYRRRVAQLMDLLGAETRFQAGVRAAELGLTRGVLLHEATPAGPAGPRRRELLQAAASGNAGRAAFLQRAVPGGTGRATFLQQATPDDTGRAAFLQTRSGQVQANRSAHEAKGGVALATAQQPC